MAETQETMRAMMQQEVDAMKQLGVQQPEGFMYVNTTDFILQLGRFYKYQKLPRLYPRMPANYCFDNATRLALDEGLVYVEGFAAIETLPIPIHHAWCVRRGTDQVIDPTATHTRFYFGVPFKTHVVRAKKRGYSLIDNWEDGWPLLRLPIDQAKELLADTL